MQGPAADMRATRCLSGQRQMSNFAHARRVVKLTDGQTGRRADEQHRCYEKPIARREMPGAQEMFLLL